MHQKCNKSKYDSFKNWISFSNKFQSKNHQKSQGACDVGPTSADYEKKMMLASFLLLDVKFPIIDN